LLNSLNILRTDQSITDVVLAKEGNKEAFCRIIESNKNQLYRIAKGILYLECDIEDVLQEVILKAWQQIASLKNNKYFKSWIIRILINECYSILRKRKKIISLEEIGLLESDNLNSNEKLDLWNALNLLNDELRTVIILFYYEDLPYKDIAKILNLSIGTVRSRLSRAKDKLEEILNANIKEDGYGK
jgi:RNA polymerase sigma-70 factor, ECF subfamily